MNVLGWIKLVFWSNLMLSTIIWVWLVGRTNTISKNQQKITEYLERNLK